MNDRTPLTETVYLVLLSLIEPGHGYVIMQRILTLSDGRVNMAAGTLYGALDNVQSAGWIKRVPSSHKRRKVYQITEAGLEVLLEDRKRMKQLVDVTDGVLDEKGVGKNA